MRRSTPAKCRARETVLRHEHMRDVDASDELKALSPYISAG